MFLQTVLRFINENDTKKSSVGEIFPTIIKLAKKEILIPITNFINKCISIKSFPDELKVADVIPASKKEDPNNKANYRPISLLPIISKIFERVLFEQIEKFSDKILSPKLCGFRKDHSTQHVLVAKLSTYGFEAFATSLICNYFSNRYQRVKIGSVFSSYLEILRGVPQGSILGPILLNIFINYLIFFI